jgi:5-enolpyruvylshikimate-3-phosphate synthase
MNQRFEPSGGLLAAPADKSLSHRAALLGAMASEPVRIENYPHAADTDSTLQAVRALGSGHGQLKGWMAEVLRQEYPGTRTHPGPLSRDCHV